MAYRWLYERYEQPFLRTAARMLGRQQEAEDAVQETFLKLHRGIHLYRSGAKFSSYFFRILLNTCYDMLRRRSPEQSEDFDKAGFSHQPSMELRHSLEEAIAALPEQMRASFVLFAVEGFSQAEISDILGISIGTVKSSIHWARSKLRKWLAGSGKEVSA